MGNKPEWIEYAERLQAIAQAGLTYSEDKYHRERFEQIRDISIDILNNYTDLKREKIRDLFANGSGYPTPKVEVRGAIFKDDQILLVKEKIDNCWSLPGGWAEVELSLKENIIKEAKEEAGVEIEAKRIVAILDRKKHNTPPMPYGIYKVFVECEYIRGQFKENIETSKAEFFSLDNLPKLSESRNTKKQIEICFKAKDNDQHEAIFD